MNITRPKERHARIEMIPLIDVVFLLLVFFVYAMLSMAVNRSLPVRLPASTTAKMDKRLLLSVTVKADGRIFVNKTEIAPGTLSDVLRREAATGKEKDVLLFADRSLSYQRLFHVLDEIRTAGLTRISLQAKAE